MVQPSAISSALATLSSWQSARAARGNARAATKAAQATVARRVLFVKPLPELSLAGRFAMPLECSPNEPKAPSLATHLGRVTAGGAMKAGMMLAASVVMGFCLAAALVLASADEKTI